MADKKWLTLRGTEGSEGKTWHAVKAVPRKLQPLIRGKNGKPMRHLLKSLKTTDLTVARARRHAALAEFNATIEAARKRTVASGIMEAAAQFHLSLTGIEAGNLAGFPAPPPGTDAKSFAIGITVDAIEQSAGEIATNHSPALAEAFHGIATGTALPLLHHLESWLAEGGRKGPVALRTQRQYRSAVSQFAEWCKGASVPATVQAVSKAVAGRYVTEEFMQKKADRATTTYHVAALSGYWRWLLKRAGIEANPWQGQAPAKEKKRDANGGKNKRPYTYEELRTLVDGESDDVETKDAILVAALSGMRAEEIYRLTVADCADGLFVIDRSKTEAGIREAPIHSDLVDLVKRRCADKKPEDYLFHEPGPEREGVERSNNMRNRFTDYRRSLGVDDVPKGKRQSRIDFHSLRRWFITVARRKYDRAVVAAIVGHEAGNITDDVYSGGPDADTKRLCVESVRLPAKSTLTAADPIT